MLPSYLSCSAAALISYFCISVYFIIVTLAVVAFDNLHSTIYRNEMNVTFLFGRAYHSPARSWLLLLLLERANITVPYLLTYLLLTLE